MAIENIEQLFGSKTRVKLLSLFMSNPGRSFYVREITRKVDEQINSVRRELSNLLSIGVIKSESSNNRLYYEADQNSQLYGSLSSIFNKEKKATASSEPEKEIQQKSEDGTKNQKVIDVEDENTRQFRMLGNVELAVMGGSFTRDELASVDLLVVGDINRTRLLNLVGDLEKKESFEIRYTSMPASEFEYRMDINDRFLSNFLETKLIVVIDKNNKIKKGK